MQLRQGVRERNAGRSRSPSAPRIFINAEPVMKRYIERSFSGGMKRTYELEHHDTSSKASSSGWSRCPNSRTRPT
jgi:hypothetical protein